MATTAAFTSAQFDALPYDEGRRWELLEGDLIEVSSPTLHHQEIVSRFLLALRRYFETSSTHGTAYTDIEFALTGRDRLRPDVCILLAEKTARLDPDKIPVPGAPDLAVEAISATERAGESHEKVRVYLRNGTAEVWQLYPKPCTVQIHRGENSTSLDSGQRIATPLLPDFTLSVSSIFE